MRKIEILAKGEPYFFCRRVEKVFTLESSKSTGHRDMLSSKTLANSREQQRPVTGGSIKILDTTTVDDKKKTLGGKKETRSGEQADPLELWRNGRTTESLSWWGFSGVILFYFSANVLLSTIDWTGTDARFVPAQRHTDTEGSQTCRWQRCFDNSSKNSGPVTKDCGAPCNSMFFSENERTVLKYWVGSWAAVCVASCLFTRWPYRLGAGYNITGVLECQHPTYRIAKCGGMRVLTFLIDSSRFRYPERPIVFLAICYLIVGCAYVAGLGAGDSVACREPFQSHIKIGRMQMLSTITQIAVMLIYDAAVSSVRAEMRHYARHDLSGAVCCCRCCGCWLAMKRRDVYPTRNDARAHEPLQFSARHHLLPSTADALAAWKERHDGGISDTFLSELGSRLDIKRQETMPPGHRQSTSCTVLFMALYFCCMAAFAWWACLALAWFLAAGLKWGHEAIESRSHLFHLVAWAIPAVQTIFVLALGKVEGCADTEQTDFTADIGKVSDFKAPTRRVVLGNWS
uniref:G-protein coupled receptors family 2 profile 2 domain-containing protein n=1 Tax=Anopheles farauti TaxID=69004 RepID=A0A182Q7M0_9DIPT